MSTEYFLVCDKCRIGINILCISFGRFIFYHGEPDCMKKLTEFFDKHLSCALRIVIEDGFYDLSDEEEENPYMEIEWVTNSKKVIV